VNIYRKARQRLSGLREKGIEVMECEEKAFGELMGFMAAVARDRGMALSGCAQEKDLTGYGVLPGKCIDDEQIREVFGLEVNHAKDPSQRKACRCVVSKDIGCTTPVFTDAPTATPPRASTRRKKTTAGMIPTRRRCSLAEQHR